MATYSELYSLQADSALRNRIRVAVVKKAQLLIDAASPTQAQLKWARDALLDVDGEASMVFSYVLAANSAVTVAQIQSATDAAIQTNVNAAVDKLLTIV